MDKRVFETKQPGRGLYGIRHGWWVVICLLYVLSPIDLVPELIFAPLGFVDDAGIAAFGIFNFVKWLKARRRRAVSPEPLEAPRLGAG
jgi:uncharacterized membrane protein YkvA (DUF1232 family)